MKSTKCDNEYPIVYSRNHTEIFQITPNVYFRKGDLAARGQCNGAFFVSGGRVAALDAPTLEGAMEMEMEARELFGLPLDYLFITHHHEDHVLGLPYFLQKPITVFCATEMVPVMQTMAEPSSKAAIVGLKNETKVFLGNMELRLFTVGHTMHTPYDMFVYLPDEGALCTGDCAVAPKSLFYKSADVFHWIRGLRELEALPLKNILPGHGGVCGKSILRETSDFLECLLNYARSCLDEISPKYSDMDAAALDKNIKQWLENKKAAYLRDELGGTAERSLRMVFRWLLFEKLR